MQNTQGPQGNSQTLYIDNSTNRARFNEIADFLSKSQKTNALAALEKFKDYVQHMDLKVAESMIIEDFPGIQLTESPAAGSASNTHATQIAKDEKFARELDAAPPTVIAQSPAAGAAGVDEANLDETKDFFFEGALTKINEAVIKSEKPTIELDYFSDEAKNALTHYETIAINLKQNAYRLGIDKINFDTIRGQLNGTHLEKLSKEALSKFHESLNPKRRPENTDNNSNIAQDLNKHAEKPIDDIIAGIAADAGIKIHEAGADESPAAGSASDTRARQIAEDRKLAEQVDQNPTVVRSSPAAGGAGTRRNLRPDTSNDEEIARALAAGVEAKADGPELDTSRDEELARRLAAGAKAGAPERPAAGASATRISQIAEDAALARALDGQDGHNTHEAGAAAAGAATGDEDLNSYFKTELKNEMGK